MKNAVFWDVSPCGTCKNRCFGGINTSVSRVTRIGEIGTLAVTSNRNMLRKILYERGSSSVTPKRWFLQESHGVTSKKTAFFVNIISLIKS
jgi:hypothetical protein